MKRLKHHTFVVIEARDWEGDSSWQSPEERREPAPLGKIRGCVDWQDDTTLCLYRDNFPGDPDGRTDSIKIPIGCIEAVYEAVERREPLWMRVKKKGRR